MIKYLALIGALALTVSADANECEQKKNGVGVWVECEDSISLFREGKRVSKFHYYPDDEYKFKGSCDYNPKGNSIENGYGIEKFVELEKVFKHMMKCKTPPDSYSSGFLDAIPE